MTDFFKKIVKQISDENTSVLNDGLNTAEIRTYYDTGSYMLNAVMSGSLYKGAPSNRITMFAGESGVGKTYFTLNILYNFLKKSQDGIVIYFDTESAITKDDFILRNIDPNRVIISEQDTVEAFRSKAIQIVDTYLKEDIENRVPCIFVLDSLGNLSSNKEMKDSTEEKTTVDMTRAKAIRGMMRTLTLRLGKANIPLYVTNHTYDNLNPYATESKIVGGGHGLLYTASSIMMLTKKKDKEDKEIVGNIIKVRAKKSRISRENAEVMVKLSYKNGLDRYYGLLDLADKYGIIEKTQSTGRITFPDGSKHFEKSIYNEPEKFFINEIMEKLEAAARIEFRYGKNIE